MRKFRGRVIPESYHELCEMWDDYFDSNGIYPNSLVCQTDKNLPAWARVKEMCGDKYINFCEIYNVNKRNNKKEYVYYCELVKELAINLNRTPTVKDLRESSKDIPDYRWLVENCPDKSVIGYNEFIIHIGLKPYYDINKEMAIDIILNKAKEINRNFKIDDFKNPKQDEIGVSTISRIWGTFNNMLIDLNLPINQVGRSTLEKPIIELEKDIADLCKYLYENNGHKIVSIDDIKNCGWCQSEGTYNRRFKMEFNMTVGEYIESIGYTPNKAGMGMVYEFEDGEITTSKYEYNVSTYLRKNNISYERNVKYNLFASNYIGNKDCDYLINDKWYVEIAGMLDSDKINIDNIISHIHIKYKKDLDDKIKMLESASLNYLIIYPHDFKEKSLDEIFSFLS